MIEDGFTAALVSGGGWSRIGDATAPIIQNLSGKNSDIQILHPALLRFTVDRAFIVDGEVNSSGGAIFQIKSPQMPEIRNVAQDCAAPERSLRYSVLAS